MAADSSSSAEGKVLSLASLCHFWHIQYHHFAGFVSCGLVDDYFSATHESVSALRHIYITRLPLTAVWSCAEESDDCLQLKSHVTYIFEECFFMCVLLVK